MTTENCFKVPGVSRTSDALHEARVSSLLSYMAWCTSAKSQVQQPNAAGATLL
jgi:hypothetical protein